MDLKFNFTPVGHGVMAAEKPSEALMGLTQGFPETKAGKRLASSPVLMAVGSVSRAFDFPAPPEPAPRALI
jgi:hypothetical protein